MGSENSALRSGVGPVGFPALRRRKPRDFVEWSTLRRWGRIPSWEEDPPGYLLRQAREAAGLTQAQLARRLDCSQQAVAQAERWTSNPTLAFARLWAEAIGAEVRFSIARPD